MKKILKLEKAIKISKELRKQNKSIVLVGGCFDILHIEHIMLIRNAKKYASSLFVLLESDESVRKQKGINRPINNQKTRAEILSSLIYVDYVVLLPGILKDKDYDDLIKQIKPSYLATTQNDPYAFHKKRQAKLINAKMIYVTKRNNGKSTTNMLKLLANF